MSDSFIEKIFCRHPIMIRDTYASTNLDLGQEILKLQAQAANLTRERDSIVESTTQTKQQDIAKIAYLEEKVTRLNGQISDLTSQLAQKAAFDPKTSQTFGNLPAGTQNALLAYMDKYPEAFVTYGGRYWGTNKSRYSLDVKAWLMEGQNDWEIVSMVKACKGRVSDVLKESPDIGFHRACDIAYMRLTHALGDSISYQYDDRSWGENEFWQFASETRTMRTGDCEDKAILNHVGARIAGIPWEMLRITAGTTYSGEGHCTSFYYASDLKWHHRNSTTNYQADKDPVSLPKTGDSSESLNIKQPWFSATDSKTFNWFGTEANKKEAMKVKDDGFFKFLKISKI